MKLCTYTDKKVEIAYSVSRFQMFHNFYFEQTYARGVLQIKSAANSVTVSLTACRILYATNQQMMITLNLTSRRW